MFHMSDDSDLFRTAHELIVEEFHLVQGIFERAPEHWIPLYEAKMVHQYDHRFATYEGATQANLNVGILAQSSDSEKEDAWFTTTPKYWVSSGLLQEWQDTRNDKWLLAFRKITSAITERTSIFALLPLAGAGDSLLFVQPGTKAHMTSCLLANANSLVLDYAVRQKIGGSNLAFHILRQLPFISPGGYSEKDVNYIAPRVLELSYTAWEMESFAKQVWDDSAPSLQLVIEQQYLDNLGSSVGRVNVVAPSDFNAHSHLLPFRFLSNRRIIIRSELDAYYSHLYGLTRDELRYILDPKECLGDDFPSESFRVMKEREEKEFGEYRTRRLVLEAFDKLAETDRFRGEMASRKSAFEIPARQTLVAVQ
jgi:hypothetical protein